MDMKGRNGSGKGKRSPKKIGRFGGYGLHTRSTVTTSPIVRLDTFTQRYKDMKGRNGKTPIRSNTTVVPERAKEFNRRVGDLVGAGSTHGGQ